MLTKDGEVHIPRIWILLQDTIGRHSANPMLVREKPDGTIRSGSQSKCTQLVGSRRARQGGQRELLHLPLGVTRRIYPSPESQRLPSDPLVIPATSKMLSG